MSEDLSKKVELLVELTPSQRALLHKYQDDADRIFEYAQNLANNLSTEEVIELGEIFTELKEKNDNFSSLKAELSESPALPESELNDKWQKLEELKNELVNLKVSIDKKLAELESKKLADQAKQKNTAENSEHIKVLSEETVEKFNSVNEFFKSQDEDVQNIYSDIYNKTLETYQLIMSKLNSAPTDDLVEEIEALFLQFDSNCEGLREAIKAESVSDDEGLDDEPALDTSSFEEEKNTLTSYFQRWKAGDVTLFDKGLHNNLSVIKRSLRQVLLVAGYSRDDVNKFFHDEVNPWVANVVKTRRNNNYVEKGRNLLTLRKQILDSVQNLLKDRDLDTNILDKVLVSGSQEELKIAERKRQDLTTEFQTLIEMPEVTKSSRLLLEELAEKLDKAGEARSPRVKNEYLMAADKIIGEIKNLLPGLHLKVLSEQTVTKFDALNKFYKAQSEEVQNTYDDIYTKTLETYQLIMSKLNSAPTDDLVEEIEALFLQFDSNCEGLREAINGVDNTVDSSTSTPVDPLNPSAATGTINPIRAASTASVTPAPASSTTLNQNLVKDYQEERAAFLAEKQSFKNIEKKYQDSLKKYYEEQGVISKSVQGVRNLFGFNPKLTLELAKLQEDYRAVRKNYAARLTESLKLRSYLYVNNKRFSAEDDHTKRVFGTKFILQPKKDLLELQENVLRDKEAKSRFHRVFKFMVEHKKATRAVGLTIAAGIGAATGGMLGAGIGVGRWTASTFGGAAAAAAMYKGLEGKVLQAKSKHLGVENLTTATFSIADFDALEKALIDAEQAKGRAELRRTASAVGAAVVTGGVAGFGSSFYSAGVSVADSTESLSNTPADSSARTGTVSPVPKPSASEPVLAQASSPEEITPTPRSTASASEVAPITDANIEPYIMVKRISVPFTDLQDSVPPHNIILSDATLAGDFKAHPIPYEQQVEISKIINLTAKDLLEAKPHLSQDALETAIFEKLQAKYQLEAWWVGAKVKEFNFGEVKFEPVSVESKLATSPTIAETSNSAPPASLYSENLPSQSNEYVVKRGDTLWEIVETKFAKELEATPAEKRGALLGQFFDRVRNDPELIKSIGLRSVNDIDLIYPNEKLQLSNLETSLERFIEREAILDNFRQTGPLPIAADDGIQNIPIKVIEETPVDGGTAINIDSGPTYTEAAARPNPVPVEAKPALNNPLIPPQSFSLSGQYADHPEYKKYIEQVFGNGKLFEQTIARAVQSFDNETYDFFDRPGFFNGGTYESPYTFLSEMSLDEIKEFKSQPNSEVRAFLAEKNIKYETYLDWLDRIDTLKDELPHQGSTTAGDLFKRAIAENKLTLPTSSIPNNLSERI